MRFSFTPRSNSWDSGSSRNLWVGLTDNGGTGDSDGANNSQDFVGMEINGSTSGTGKYSGIGGSSINLTTVADTTSQISLSGDWDYSTPTTYYFEIIKSGGNVQIKRYTNSDYDTEVSNSATTSVSANSPTGLRYIKFMTWDQSGTDGEMEANVPKVEFWKAKSNLAENTLFVETGTYKYHWLKGNEWKDSGDAGFLVSPSTYADSSNWTNPYGLTEDYASIDTTNKRVNFAFTTSNTANSGKCYKLPHALSEKWILQYQLNLSALAGNDFYHLSLTENDGLCRGGGQGQSIDLQTQGASYNRWTMGTRVMGESTVNSEVALNNSTWSANTEYYCTLTRGSDKDNPWEIVFTVRTGSHTGSVVGNVEITQGSSTSDGAERAGRIRNESIKYLCHTSKGNGSSGQQVGYVSNVYLKDGVTTI